MIALPQVLEARLAMPTDVQVSYVVAASLLCRWKCGPAEWRRLCRGLDAGEDAERAYTKFVGDKGTYQMIPRVAPGVVLKGARRGESAS